VEGSISLVNLLACNHWHIHVSTPTQIPLVALCIGHRWLSSPIAFKELLVIDCLGSIVITASDHAIVVVIDLHHIRLVPAVLDLVVNLLPILGADEVVSKGQVVLILLLLQESLLFSHLSVRTEALLEMTMRTVVALVRCRYYIFGVQTRNSFVGLHVGEWIEQTIVISLTRFPWLFDKHTLFVALTCSFDALFLRTNHSLVAIRIGLFVHVNISIVSLRTSSLFF